MAPAESNRYRDKKLPQISILRPLSGDVVKFVLLSDCKFQITQGALSKTLRTIIWHAWHGIACNVALPCFKSRTSDEL